MCKKWRENGQTIFYKIIYSLIKFIEISYHHNWYFCIFTLNALLKIKKELNL